MSQLVRNLLFIICILALTACATSGTIDNRISYWKQTFESRIPPGSDKSKVQNLLTELNLQHGYYESEHTFYALDKDLPNRWVMYESAISIKIILDENEKVKGYTFDDVYSGL